MFPLGPSQMSLGPGNSLAFLHKTDAWLTLCLIRFQGAFLDSVAKCVTWPWFPKVLPSPSDGVHHSSMAVSNAILPKGSKVTRIHQRLSPMVFTYRNFSWLPESFHNFINCRWWRTQIRSYLVLRNVVFNLTDNSLTKFSKNKAFGGCFFYAFLECVAGISF